MPNTVLSARCENFTLPAGSPSSTSERNFYAAAAQVVKLTFTIRGSSSSSPANLSGACAQSADQPMVSLKPKLWDSEGGTSRRKFTTS